MWKADIPESIKVGRKITSSTPFIAPPGGSCGGAFYKLKSRSKQEILKTGQDFFSDAKTSRSGKKKYEWFPSGQAHRQLTAAMRCTVNSRSKRKTLFGDIGTNSGNYFAYDQRSKMQVAVFIDKEVVFIGYWD